MSCESVRYPAYPLVVHDPYFSIWSRTDRLSDSFTCHWTGKGQTIAGLIRIDGKAFCFMSDIPGAPKMNQTSVRVLPTRTIYTFEECSVRFRLTFLTPALLHKLNVLSRPITYLCFDAESLDGKTHDLAVYFDADGAIAVNEPTDKITWSRYRHCDLDLMCSGSAEQKILSRAGDDLRIDWVHIYLGLPWKFHGTTALESNRVTRNQFLSSGTLPQTDNLNMPQAAKREWLCMAAVLPMKAEAGRTDSAYGILAYHDAFSIEYLYRKLPGYWTMETASFSELLSLAVREKEALAEECARYDAELRIKKSWVEENFKRIGNLPISCDTILPSPEVNGYRNKAQIPCGIDSNGMPAFGFFAAHSHRIIPCEACCLQPDFYPAIIRCLTDWMVQYGIKPYDEQTQTGTVRHLFLRDGRDSGEIMVCVVANADSLPHKDALVCSLMKVNPKIASIVLNVNRKKGNSILGEKCITLWGKDTITDRLCGLFFDISPLSFYQVNHDGAELLYQTAADFAALSGTEVLLDLYCGVGTIGLSMAKRAARLIGVEVIPAAVENAGRNAARNGIQNAEFICADAGQAARQLIEAKIFPDVIIVDPPRRGCDTSVLDAIIKMSPGKIVMVSCNSATAARDCAYLSEHNYTVTKLRAVDMFPRTGHVETVCLLSKLKVKEHIEIDLNRLCL